MDEQIKAKIDQLEALKGNVFCEICSTYVKEYVACKTTEDTEKCPRLREPKTYKDTCPYCDIKIDNPLSLGGHMVTCKLNPKVLDRNKKIAESHTGLKHSEECKEKIAQSMREYHESLNDENEVVEQEIIIDDKKIDIKIY
jgi:hypothetical protein